jgi:hypothetical protein
VSDINYLIATNGINAFNNGYQAGILAERNRILEIAQKIAFDNWKGHDLISLQDLEEHVTDEYK